MKAQVDRSHYLFDNKSLISLIIPLIIEQFLAVTVGLVASIMVASVGEAAVSGVSLVDSVMILFIGTFAALATGGAVITGQYIGMQNFKLARLATTQMVWFITLIGIVISIVLYLISGFILGVVFGRIEADVYMHARTYLNIVVMSVPFIALYNACAALFRSMGNSKLPMMVALLMNVINVGLGALLIFVFGFGTDGVAISTLTSRAIAAVLITWKLTDQKNTIYLTRTLKFKPDWAMIKRTLRIGVPNGLENFMFQMGKILVLSLVSSFGTYAITANAVGSTVVGFTLLSTNAINLATTPIVSRCKGAGDITQVQYYARKLHIIAYISLIVSNGLFVLGLPFIIRVYQLSEQTAQITTNLLLLSVAISCVVWPVSFTTPTVLRASGDVKIVMLIAIISMWTFRIGASFLFARVFGMGVYGVWVAMFLDWFVRGIAYQIRYRQGKWKTIRSI